MKILIYGAGVQGSVYAARLKQSGNDVWVLARGTRLAEIRSHGIVLREMPRGLDVATPVEVTERLDPADYYDLVLVTVRRSQLQDLLPQLAANAKIPAFLFLLNNATGFAEFERVLGPSRVLAGFPTVGGYRENHVVIYTLIRQQNTTLGELNGQVTRRLNDLRQLMEQAGFPVVISRDIDGWMKTHAVFIIAVAGALYMAGGDNYKLARMPATLKLLLEGVREGFRALQAMGTAVTPFKLRVLFLWLPPLFARIYWKRYLGSAYGELTVARHARAAVDEMKELVKEWRALQGAGSPDTPALDRLCATIEQY